VSAFVLAQSARLQAANQTAVSLVAGGWWEWLLSNGTLAALLDAALVAVVLVLGITAGLLSAAHALLTWRTLVERVGE